MSDLTETVPSNVDLVFTPAARQAQAARADGGDLQEFTAGAHIELRAPNGLIRKYSLCNDPAECERYEIAVKCEHGGAGGSLSMARADPDSATADFFVCLGEQPELDFGGRRNPDGQGFAACTSTKTVLGLADGSHTFSVVAVDRAGNISTPATRTGAPVLSPAMSPNTALTV